MWFIQAASVYVNLFTLVLDFDGTGTSRNGQELGSYGLLQPQLIVYWLDG
jgi:hypothetical protein